MLQTEDIQEYFRQSREAAKRAYNPYSHFSVGCVLIDQAGKVFPGCNIESASYSATLCAERVAAAQAIAQGSRNWDSIFIVSPSGVSPCGVCRQFLFEFAPQLQVYLGTLTTDEVRGPIALTELLPMASGLQQAVIQAQA